jgi:hypothetical protein
MAERFGLQVGPARNAYHGHYAAAIERELTDQARLFDVENLDGRAA